MAEVLGGVPFAKIHWMGERPHEVRWVPPRAFTRCGLAWDKARLGAPGLGGWEAWPFWTACEESWM